MSEFCMPILGSDMTAGTLVAWRKKPGDSVKRGEIVAEVETEKGTIDVEIFTSGVIETLLAEPGQTVPVGTPLAIVREIDAVPGPVSPPHEIAMQPSVAVTAPRPAARPVDTTIDSEKHLQLSSDLSRLRISPAARRRARELSVDPTRISGTGRGGAITIEDIEAASRAPTLHPEVAPAAVQPAQPLPVPSAPPDRFTRLRQTIAAAMSRSKREIPHYYLSTQIDMNTAQRWLAEKNANRPVTDRLLYGALLLKAVALALSEVRELNAVWEGNRAINKADVHVGVAISLRQGGLIAPALHHTDRLELDELMTKFRDLVNRARAGSLRSSELSDPTITVTSLGEQGVEEVFGVIYPPQVAIVGFGKMVERPWSVGGQIVSRPIVTATLSGDHRVTDGHRGAIFLAAVNRLLQEPEKL